jgi:nucleotide-binding universal stress UspA family protein
MSTDLIVSYDGTPNDDDALALGKMLARGGASSALAYVRHSREFDPRREELAQHDAERRLAQGASLLGDSDTPRHVVFSASTGEGLEQLAAAEGAAVIVFGSDYRTPPGHAEPGNTAQHLLEGGPVAVAVAAAGLRTQGDPAIETIAVAGDDDDGCRDGRCTRAQARRERRCAGGQAGGSGRRGVSRERSGGTYRAQRREPGDAQRGARVGPGGPAWQPSEALSPGLRAFTAGAGSRAVAERPWRSHPPIAGREDL